MNINSEDKSLNYRGHSVSKQAYETLKNIESVLEITDHTNLSPVSAESDIQALCSQALQAKEIFGIGPATVCVHPAEIALCSALLKNSGIGVCATVGFPLGKCSTASKVADTIASIDSGASEIDMVINISALKDNKTDILKKDIVAVVEAAKTRASGTIVKVIIECCYLSDQEKKTACIISEQSGADYVKTSTGFGTPGKDIPVGATADDVRLMRTAVSDKVKVKASGGIQNIAQALEMKAAGASRLGASKIVTAALTEAALILNLDKKAGSSELSAGKTSVNSTY